MSQGIAFSPDLVQGMLDDHRQLLAVFGEMSRAVKAQDAENFRDMLIQFKSMLTAHLLKEAIKLYIYLRQKLKNDPASYQLITGYKTEMDGISKVAMQFVDDFSTLRSAPINFVELNARLAELGRVLGDRIRREENELYPLYHDQYD